MILVFITIDKTINMEYVIDGKHLNRRLDQQLAPFAQYFSTSQGRAFSEPCDPDRTPFQRDRDRIIHTGAFRRLKGKMQVVSPSKGDHFRNRLTHTLEVAQIARDLARQLHLNEDLSEAIALGHDLGHPPFGHVGERALHQCMQEFGREFDHNRQSLRVVTTFERRYEDFPGLNLSKEVLNGLQKHERGFLNAQGEKIFFPHLEMQLVDISDEIAYLAADLEDGLRAGFLDFEILGRNEICVQVFSEVGDLNQTYRSTFIRRLIRNLLNQLIVDTRNNLEFYTIERLADVQACPNFVVAFSPEFYQKFLALKQLLNDEYYTKPDVIAIADGGAELITKTFHFLLKNTAELPVDFLPEQDNERRICDYIAGMTDKYLEDYFQKNVV